LNPEDTKKFFNYVDKNWDAEEESDGSKTEKIQSAATRNVWQDVDSAMAKTLRVKADETEESDGSQSEDGWEDPPKLGGEPSVITPMESDGNEDVSTGKVGKKDKDSYHHAYKLALKKYQIHSADELDTPAERKGFTDYVDRLWKGGEVKDHALESDMAEAPKKSPAQRNRERIKKQKKQQQKQKQKKQASKEPLKQLKDKPTFAQKVKDKTSAAASAAKSKMAQLKVDRDKAAAEREKKQELQKKERDRDQADREKERERDQDAREKEREQTAKEKDNGDNGTDDDDDDKKKEKGNDFASFMKQAAGETKKAAQQQAAQYTVKS